MVKVFQLVNNIPELSADLVDCNVGFRQGGASTFQYLVR